MRDCDESERPHRLLLSLCRPGLCFSHTDQRHAQKLAVIVGDFLRQRFVQFVAVGRSEPLAMTFCNDPTPLSLRERYRIEDGGGDVVIREGGKSQEFLIQTVWCYNLRAEAAVMFGPPTPMADKSAATHFAALGYLVDVRMDTMRICAETIEFGLGPVGDGMAMQCTTTPRVLPNSDVSVKRASHCSRKYLATQYMRLHLD